MKPEPTMDADATSDEDAPVSGRAVREPAQRAIARSGARAEVALGDDGAETIEVRDAEDALLFSYAPDTGRCVITVPRGDLVLAAPHGAVEIVGAGGVRVRGGDAGVELRSGDAAGSPRVKLGRDDVTLSSPSLEVAASRAEMLVGEGVVRGIHLEVVAERLRSVAGRVESVATQIVSRAKRVVRHVEEVEQLTAGRVRTLVGGAFTLKAQRAAIDAGDDVKIDGKRIHLG